MWLSVLEASYIIFRLRPFHSNVRKRLTKTSKIYFHDTGLLCHLLGIESANQLRDSSLRGSIFENLIVEETLKQRLNEGYSPDLYFYRDESKIEVDLIDLTDRQAPELIEIKASSTFRSNFTRHLDKVGDLLGIPREKRGVVMRSDDSHVLNGIKLWSAHDWLMR